MKIAIITLLILGIFEWTINDTKYTAIRTLFNLAALICFLIYSH
jgi:hypothetical protein